MKFTQILQKIAETYPKRRTNCAGVNIIVITIKIKTYCNMYTN